MEAALMIDKLETAIKVSHAMIQTTRIAATEELKLSMLKATLKILTAEVEDLQQMLGWVPETTNRPSPVAPTDRGHKSDASPYYWEDDFNTG